MGYRKDINGLRAFAVTLVIFFHFEVKGFEGGFLGVDVFFVISGYLMTKIIFERSVKLGAVDGIFDFYISRAKRIIPPLVFLCFILLLLGYFWVLPVEYKFLSIHAISALGFFSNIKFLNEFGYFDWSASEKILLHTWSLSLEWQFYLIFPLIVIFCCKFFPSIRTTKILLTTLLVCSLAAYFLELNANANAVFYLLPYRSWELLAGTMAYVFLKDIQLKKWQRNAMILIGIFFIVLVLILFEQCKRYPGLVNVLIVCAVVAIIAANCHIFIFENMLSQWLGKISYSLYLWHWPVVVVLLYMGVELRPVISIFAIGLVVFLGWMSWFLIELKFTGCILASRKKQSMLQLFFMLFSVIVMALVVRQKDGFPNRFGEPSKIIAESFNVHSKGKYCHTNGSVDSPECEYGSGKLQVAMIGDSHANSVISSVEKSLGANGGHVLDWTISACPTIRGKYLDATDSGCTQNVERFFEKSQAFQKGVPLLIVNRFSIYFEGYNEDSIQPAMRHENFVANKAQDFYDRIHNGFVKTACDFAAHRTVFMLLPIPELKEHVPNTMARSQLYWDEKIRVSVSLEEYADRNQRAIAMMNDAAAQCGVTLLDPLPYLCQAGRCWGDQDGLPIYMDDDHLNERGGNLLIPLFEIRFKNSLEMNQ